MESVTSVVVGSPRPWSTAPDSIMAAVRAEMSASRVSRLKCTRESCCVEI